MQQLSATNTAFLAHMFDCNYRWLNARLRRKLGCPWKAEDIAAEAFAQIVAMPALDLVREPRALLTTIAQRLIYDMWRRRDLERAYLDALANQPEESHPSPEEHSVMLESLLAIDKALSGLSSKARSAFIYSQFDGLTYAEIALRLNVSASMVRQYVSKALRLCYEVTEL